jgi:hypothetical protein
MARDLPRTGRQLGVGDPGESGILLHPSIQSSVELLQLPDANGGRRLGSRRALDQVEVLPRVAQDVHEIQVGIGCQQYFGLPEVRCIDGGANLPQATEAARQA